MTLPKPVVCECGFATLDARKAVAHIKEKHPEMWVEEEEKNE